MGTYQHSGARASGKAWPLACALTLLGWLLARLALTAMHGSLAADPDADYALVIARNWLAQGRPTFDGQTLTNGFSPLWLAILAAKQALAGPALAITFGLEAAMSALALFIVLRCLPVANHLIQAGVTAAFAYLVGGFALTGLDASLLVLCASLFVAALCWSTESLLGGLALALAALLCVAARLEAALFVLPALLLAPTRLANRVLALTLTAAGLVAVGAANLHLFGSVLPVTSEVRALGGVQINHVLLSQLAAQWRLDGLGARQVLLALSLLLAPILVALSRSGTAAQALAAGAALGGWLLSATVLFGSSWRVAPGLGSAGLWPLLALVFTLAPPLCAALERLHRRLGSPRLAQPAVAGLAGLALAALLGQPALAGNDAAAPPTAPTSNGVRTLIERDGALLNGQRIAMGAGAGALAAAYGGSVVALEGVAGDQTYLAALSAGEDITPMLCARGVRFMAADHADLGDYRRRRIAVLDAARTSFAGPTVEIDRRDETARIPTASGRSLYVWRLGACWRNGYAAVDNGKS